MGKDRNMQLYNVGTANCANQYTGLGRGEERNKGTNKSTSKKNERKQTKCRKEGETQRQSQREERKTHIQRIRRKKKLNPQ